MDRYFARVVRAVIVSLFGFGGGIGLMVFIAAIVIKGDPHAFQLGLNAGVGIGMMFSIFLVGVLLPLDLTAHLFLSKGKYSELWELEQTRELSFEGSLGDLTSMCRQALLAVSAVKSVSEDPGCLSVRASIGMSWRSPGENMEVVIKAEAGNKWSIRCTSRPLSRSIVFDYGKNFENVETFSARMNELINLRRE